MSGESKSPSGARAPSPPLEPYDFDDDGNVGLWRDHMIDTILRHNEGNLALDNLSPKEDHHASRDL